MQDHTNDKQFWNNYVTYWETKVQQANEEENPKDKTNDDGILETYFKKLRVNSKDQVLDYGCGSGRLYPIYKKMVNSSVCNYTGIDISGVSLEHAQGKNPDLEVNKNLFEFNGREIPFADETFDKINCFGVFDACSQEMVLGELLRALKQGGLLLLTGKNYKYCSEDEEAKIAEVNARKKEHPNYFTDAASLIGQLPEHNAEVVEACFFRKRGDFPKDRYMDEMPETFYEWALIIRKTGQYQKKEFTKFSDKFSENCKEELKANQLAAQE